MGKPMKLAINIFLCHLFFRVKYENLEELQKLDRCVVCPNHTSIYDPFWIYEKADNMYIMAKAELFKNKLMAKIYKRYNVFPVDRTKVDVKSTLIAKKIFEDNKGRVQFLIFPEGKVITDETEIGKVRNGGVYIAATAGVPILPVHISRNVRLFKKITVTFGKPIYLDKDILSDKERIKEKSKELIKEIYKMEGKEII